MSDNVTRFFGSRWGIVLVGGVIGLLGVVLQETGNPPNMGICVACFERDIAGALGLHRLDVAQYLRPEIMAFVLGSLAAALVFGEFRPRGGSAPVVRFVLGVLAMVGSLAFLGCPWRALFRLTGGDLNALVGLAGLAAGIAMGVSFLKVGYNPGRARETYAVAGWVLPGILVGLLLLLLFRPKLGAGGAVFFSDRGPGARHAPLLVSLGVGLVVGFLAQRTRFCTMGSIRDVLLMGNTHLISGVAGLLVVAFAANLFLGNVSFGLTAQPISHSNHVWNFLGMMLAGLAFALAGGCPGRQLFLAGEGDVDAAVFVLGMITGAGLSHNLALAGRPDKVVEGVVHVGGLTTAGMVAVVAGLVICLAFGVTMRERA